MKLYPLDECARAAERHMQKGFEVFQQFNCAHCGAKQTVATPNRFYISGSCEECGKLTDIIKDGCNYLLVGERMP